MFLIISKHKIFNEKSRYFRLHAFAFTINPKILKNP